MDVGDLPASPLPFHAFCREVFTRDGYGMDTWITRLGCEPHEPARWAQGIAMPSIKTLIAMHEAVMGSPMLVSGEQRARWLRIIEGITTDVALVPSEMADKYGGTLAWTMLSAMNIELAKRLDPRHVGTVERLALMRQFLNHCDVAAHYRPKR